MKDIAYFKAKIALSLPFCLHLNDENYQVQMPNYLASIGIERKKHEHVCSQRKWDSIATSGNGHLPKIALLPGSPIIVSSFL